MANLLGFLVAAACLQAAVLAADEGTVCGKVQEAESAPLTGDRRWYYCKSSGDISDNRCFIDVHPDGKGNLIHKRTSFDSETQKLEVVTFSVKDANDEKLSATFTDVGVTSDNNCKLSIRCWGNAPFFMFICRTKEGCQGNTHQAFLDEIIGKIKSMEGMETVRTEMKNYYNEDLCKE